MTKPSPIRDRAPMGDALAYFEKRRDAIVAFIQELVRIETPSGYVEGISRLNRVVTQRLDAAGFTCGEVPAEGGPVLHGRRSGEDDDAPPLALVGHSDTVWPVGTIERRPPRIEHGRLYGPGVYDMKAGIALAVFALQFLMESRARLTGALDVFLSPDEETGSVSAHPHMERLLPREASALVLEPPLPDGSMKTSRKGVGMYRLEARGREAHAGSEPEQGASAVLEICRKIVEVSSWAQPADGVTINVGTVEGGVATNVVPGFAAAGIDTRFDGIEEGERLDQRLRALLPDDPRIALHLEGGIIFMPMRPSGRSRRLSERALEAAGSVGLRISCGKSGGGSDGSFLAARGLAVLDGLGADGGGAHAEGEHVIIESLPRRAAFLARLILVLQGGT